ncbi:MAG: hypothetical protein ABEI99_10770 [Halobaculum sp.]
MNVIKTLYHRTIRPLLPGKISVHNGIPTRGAVKLFDWTDEFPEYEAALLSSIRRVTTTGQQVTVVGGGIGISTVVAAANTVLSDTVTTYEGNPGQVSRVRETVRLNRVTDQCTVEHAVVGENVGVYGSAGDAPVVPPSALPDTDLLILDCEGAETTIIEGLDVLPEVIIVETHGFLGVPEPDVRAVLDTKGYTVRQRRPEDESSGVVILTATRDSTAPP